MPKKRFKLDEIMLVLLVAFIIIGLKFYSKENKTADMNAEEITSLLSGNNDISLINDGFVNEDKLKEVQNMNYNEFKNSLNAKEDFCVYIEDDKGQIVLAKGSSKLNSDGIYCRE